MRVASALWILLIFPFACEQKKTLVLKTELIQVDSLSQVILLTDSLVKPVIYSGLHGLAEQPVPEAKALFISAILPSVLIVKRELREARGRLRALQSAETWLASDSAYVDSLASRYKAPDLNSLLVRMETIPNSIVLAQAALESGWGQSRFFLEGNNIFGIWSYNPEEPRIPARLARKDRVVHVRHYGDYTECIRDYFKTLGSAPAYRDLRHELQETRDPFALLPHLKYYSEQREAYVNQLRLLIRRNDLTRYDRYVIDPSYIVYEEG